MATRQQHDNRKAQGKSDINASVPTQALDAQNRYWREQFRGEPYYMQGKEFDAYEPAYRLGAEARDAYPDKPFADIEDALRMQYEANAQAQRKLDWAQARQAVRAAWERNDLGVTNTNKHKLEQPRSRH